MGIGRTRRSANLLDGLGVSVRADLMVDPEGAGLPVTVHTALCDLSFEDIQDAVRQGRSITVGLVRRAPLPRYSRVARVPLGDGRWRLSAEIAWELNVTEVEVTGVTMMRIGVFASELKGWAKLQGQKRFIILNWDRGILTYRLDH